MTVRVVAFARLRELIGSKRDLTLPSGSTTADAWDALAAGCNELRALAGSTRIAHNGRIVTAPQTLSEGDELALLPPAGGG